MSGSATPATRNDIETCLETAKRIGFAASPIDTVTLQENQRHVGASKRAFRARRPQISQIFTLCSYKTDVFLFNFHHMSVANSCDTTSEHTLNPQTPRMKREPCYAFGNYRQKSMKIPHSANSLLSQRSPRNLRKLWALSSQGH